MRFLHTALALAACLTTEYFVAGQGSNGELLPTAYPNTSLWYSPPCSLNDTHCIPNELIRQDNLPENGVYNWHMTNISECLYEYVFQFPDYSIYPASDQCTEFHYQIIDEPNGMYINKTATAPPAGKMFDKFLLVILENQIYSWDMEFAVWRDMAEKGLLATDYYGCTHESTANYVCMWGADSYNIHTDLWVSVNASSLVDLMDDAGVSWKQYSENYVAAAGGACNNTYGQGPYDAQGTLIYQRKHVPPILFEPVSSNITRCQNIVNADQFHIDLSNDALPQVSVYTPNLQHDGHDSDSSNDPLPFSAGMWLNAWLDQYLPTLQQQGVLVMVTFDEATTADGIDPPEQENQVVTLFFGNESLVTPNSSYSGYMNHYAIARGLEANFGLGNLGRNDTAAQNGMIHDALLGAVNGTAPAYNYSYVPVAKMPQLKHLIEHSN